MKLFEDLKYVGKDKKMKIYGGKPWHCTSFVTEFSTREMKFCIQQPHYHEDIFMGYTGLSIYVLTEDELVRNFKIVKEDGSLENILHSKDDNELQKKLKKIDSCFDNMNDDEFKNIIN